MLNDQLQSVRESLLILRNELTVVQTTIHTVLSPPVTPVVEQSPTTSNTTAELARTTLVRRGSTSFAPTANTRWVYEQLEQSVAVFNANLGPNARPITLPAVRTLEQRILPLIGDFERLQRLYQLLADSRYIRWERLKNPATGRKKLQPIEMGPSWVHPVELLEAGEELETVEYLYFARARYPELTLNLLLEVFHNYAWDDGELFEEFLDQIERQYAEIPAAKRLDYVVRCLHEADRLYGGSLIEWLHATVDQAPDLYKQSSTSGQMPSKIRHYYEMVMSWDPEARHYRGNADLDFTARGKRPRNRGERRG